MIIFKDIESIRQAISGKKRAGKSIGLVPTMGAIHEGHLSLVRACLSTDSICVVSIFVNPTQFESVEGYKSYPQDQSEDLRKLEASGADMVFMPEVDEIYPQISGSQDSIAAGDIYVNQDGYLTDILCGQTRPNHFRGVLTIVTKLFNIIRPDNAYFGQKDYQQLFLIRKLVENLNFDTNIINVATKREETGLAMSSRNSKLSEDGRKRAAMIYETLSQTGKRIEASCRSSEFQTFEEMQNLILSEEAEHFISTNTTAEVSLDYLKVLDANSLLPLTKETTTAIVAMAAVVEGVRLIDNVLISVA